MKHRKLTKIVFLTGILMFFACFPGGKAHAAGAVAINSTNFPDAAFRNYVKENFDTNSNNSLSEAEIAAVKRIDVHSMDIGSLKGVEFFTSLEKLYCYYNALTELDVSACTGLTAIDCGNNLLTALNVNGCTALKFLQCGNNRLTSLNVSGCTALEELYCYDNLLTLLKFQGCGKLETLSCGRNNLKTLNVNGCPELRGFYCSNNKLRTLTVSGCGKMDVLSCENNQMTSLTLVGCPWLYDLQCYGNQLSELNIADCPKIVYAYQHGAWSETDEYQSWFIVLDKVSDYYFYCDKDLVISLGDELAIVAQPRNAEAQIGGTAKFTVSAIGAGLRYQWQYKYPDGSWTNSSLAGAKTSEITFTAAERHNGIRYRCVVKDGAGNKVISTAGELTIRIRIDTQPADVSAYVGATARFTVSATGAGLKYRWQRSADNGGSWLNVATSNEGYNKATLKLTTKAAWNGWLYRCVITDANGDTRDSDGAKLTVKPKITKHPAPVTAYTNFRAVFSVTATGAGLTYRWQRSSDGGKNWTNVATTNEGYNTATLTLKVKSAWNGWLYRCVVKDANGKTLNSNGAKLTVKPRIVTQPQPASGRVGETVTFTVKATGAGLTYKWQFSKDGGSTWKNWGTHASLDVPVTAARNNYLFRCVVKDVNGKTVISNVVKLTVIK